MVSQHEAAVENSDAPRTPGQPAVVLAEEKKFLGSSRRAPKPVHGVHPERDRHRSGLWAGQKQQCRKPPHGVLSHARSIVMCVAQRAEVPSLQVVGLLGFVLTGWLSEQASPSHVQVQ